MGGVGARRPLHVNWVVWGDAGASPQNCLQFVYLWHVTENVTENAQLEWHVAENTSKRRSVNPLKQSVAPEDNVTPCLIVNPCPPDARWLICGHFGASCEAATLPA